MEAEMMNLILKRTWNNITCNLWIYLHYRDVLDKLKKVGQRCEAETVSNFNQIEHAKGKTVTYG